MATLIEIPSDPELIRRTLAGDRGAFQRLAERHRRSIVDLARRALGSADDAQDVAQEAFLYAFLRLSAVRDPGHFADWLRHVTLSLCADYRRKRGTRRLGEPITVLNESRVEKDYAAFIAVRDAVAHLSENHRTALLLHYIGGWSLSEVAELTESPVNTVRSRLRAARAYLRSDLTGAFAHSVLVKGKRMPIDTFGLSETDTALIHAAFPGSRVLSVQNDPEPWMPFGPRLRLLLPDGAEKTVDIRRDIDPARGALLPVLERLGIPGPRLIHDPAADGFGYRSLCEPARGENLTLWALGGTPHRIRLASERAFEGIDRLQNITAALQSDPQGAALEYRTLTDEVAILTDDARWNAHPWLAEEGRERAEWLRDSWFREALAKTTAVVHDIREPLVYTDYLHFFPQGYRILPSSDPFREPLGAPGDPVYQQNPLAEVVYVFGHFGDPLLGLAMVWVYDCYPFVHTGFVEQFLWRRGVTRREFAPRLALKALQMVARDLPLIRPTEGGCYWDGLRGWVDQAVSWM